MTKSYRLRTQVGTDKNIRININQDFDFLEILSLKLRQEDVYTRFCADYGVVAGRVVVNGGYGVPNANVSIFIPLDQMDENDVVISSLYPYKNVGEKNEDGYRYNLLPYRKTYGGHTPTGTFPDIEDVLTRTEVLEVYEKYYKYTAKTNDSGDFMIVGVPLGIQTIVMDLDLSDMGCFSLRPSDLIRMGLGVPEQFDGDQFKSSTDLASLPQIVNFTKNIDVTSFWGEQELCDIGITRTDFDLRELNITIKPQSIFMGSFFSTSNEDVLRSNCKPSKETGKLCNLETGAGKILSIRQTIDYDTDGRPILEEHKLENGGKVIDEDGTWLIELPMNLNYVTTNEYGEQVTSNDPSIGIPTKAKYRFRIQYQNESVEDTTIMRGDYLVPNIREYGWTQTGKYQDINQSLQLKSYAFSLDWNDYADIDAAINCEDSFYEFNYNKVYTVSNFIDRWKWGYNRMRHLGIKEIDSRSCNQINKFPVNDGVKNFDFLTFVLNVTITLLTPVILQLLISLHLLALLYPFLQYLVNLIIWLVNSLIYTICIVVAFLSPKIKAEDCKKTTIKPLPDENPFKKISLPMMSYPDCETCPCQDLDLNTSNGDYGQQPEVIISNANYSNLINSNSLVSYLTFVAQPPSNDEEFNNGIRQFISGYQYVTGPDADNFIDVDPKMAKLPIAEVPRQGGGYKYLGYDATLSQSLNMANFRQRYFDGENLIRTTVNNTNPVTNFIEPSQSFTDSVLMIVCDPGTLNLLTAGSLVSFNDVSLINDPNISAGTVNQFNTKNITGATNPNLQNLITKTVSYVNTSGVLSTANIKIKVTENGKEYKFPAGNEYFQVITGGTVYDFSGMTNYASTTSLLNKYIFNKTQRNCYYETTSLGGQICATVKPISEYDLFQNQEIIFLTRGTDPYTQKQNIRYDLSPIFGYTFGNGPIVEGSYYLNIPIQKNTDTASSNSSWRTDYKTPESHQVSNNNNAVLYHNAYSFTPNQNQFTAFTNNTPYYYNSTDKSRANTLAYSNDIYSLSQFTSPVGVYSDIACNGAENGKSTIGFQYGQTIITSNTNDPFYTWLGPISPNFFTFKYNADYSNFVNNPSNQCSTNNTANGQFPCSTGGIGACENQSSNRPYYKESPNINIGDIIYDNYVAPGDPGNVPLYGQLDGLSLQYRWIPLFYQGVDQNGNPTWSYAVAIQVGANGEVLDYVACSGTWQGNSTTTSTCTTSPQGNIEGGTLLGGYSTQGTWMPTNPLGRHDRVFSPAYHLDSLPNITISNYQKLVFRSDRLPTSDYTEVSGNTSYSLHLNDNFKIYKLNEQGGITVVPSTQLSSVNETNNNQDFTGDTSNQYTDVILNSFTCENMTTLGCYSGNGSNFGVNQTCVDSDVVIGGCYTFVNQPFILSIPKDVKNFIEWRARFRFMFAACRGVFSQVFQNNWLNGSLYMFSFKRQTIFNVQGQPKKYKFCGTTDSIFREGQGPIYYTEGTTNSLFYRSAPYNGNLFVGQIPEQATIINSTYLPVNFNGINDRNLFFPTTIMDLGPRDLYSKEICANPSFEGNLIDTMKSTSYNDPSDILQLAIISRLSNTNFLSQIGGLGDASVDRMFSRSEKRLDGDITQLFSINSEYGIIPFGDEEYQDIDLYVQSGVGNGDALVGIFFSSNTSNRKILSPGVQTFSITPPLYNYFGYTKTQEVPMYRWSINPANPTIFGSDTNNWDTDVNGATNGFYSQKYQTLSFEYGPISPYFNDTNNGKKGYIYNQTPNGVGNPSWGTIQPIDSYIVGAPFHFYFGLNKGKTALNKFITKYIGQ
jgi:hypothetical protein